MILALSLLGGGPFCQRYIGRRWERPVVIDRLVAAALLHVVRIDNMVADTAGMRARLVERYQGELRDAELEAYNQDRDHEKKIRDLERRQRVSRAQGVDEKIANLRRDFAETRARWPDRFAAARRKIEEKVDEMMAGLEPYWDPIKVMLAEHKAEVRGIIVEAEQRATDGRLDVATYHRLVAALAASSLVCATGVKGVAGDKGASFAPTFEVLAPEWIADLKIENQRPDPTDILTCPEGVPFSYYTIEIPFPPETRKWKPRPGEVERVVVEVVEGMAWFEVGSVMVTGKDDVQVMIEWRTDTVRMAAELVTQMLTERQRNPKAETRVLVNEVNSARSHEVRQEEAHPNAEPRLRSIKFDVAPPRYLREAAERIIASKVRAHWVMGHWRNQAHGQGRSLRRQTWIAPHVRGLGEAGATMSRVAAPTSGARS